MRVKLHGVIIGNMERGVSNKQGWILQGFIENAQGDLRPQTYEEHVFCVGCHSNIGATTDESGLKNLPEPPNNEYSLYLEKNGAGDEFRANNEIIEAFFNQDGSLKPDMLNKLHNDISLLLSPSPARALQLNKAYRVIVQEQSFKKGRDATITPPENVHRKVEQDQTTGIGG